MSKTNGVMAKPAPKAKAVAAVDPAPARPVVRFHLSQEAMAGIELGEILDMEENPNDIRMAMAFMKRFLVDDQGQPLPDEEANVAIRRVTLGQLQGAYQRVMADMQETAVPNG